MSINSVGRIASLFVCLAAAGLVLLMDLPWELAAVLAVTGVFSLGGLNGLKREAGLMALIALTVFLFGYSLVGLFVVMCYFVIVVFAFFIRRIPSMLVGAVLGFAIYLAIGLFIDGLIRTLFGGATFVLATVLLTPTQMLWLIKRITDGLGLQVVGYTLHQDPNNGDTSTYDPDDHEEIKRRTVDRQVSAEYGQPILRFEVISTREEFFALRSVANLAGLWFARSGSKPFGLFKQIAVVWIVQKQDAPKRLNPPSK